jgi:5'-deoxynucleotidase YfbR-like HD superfamily hydrolase
MYRTIQELMNMMTLNTNIERVDALTHISDQIYPILEQQVDGEIRARRIMRLGMGSIAIALRHGASFSQAGAGFDSHLAYELRDVDYGHYEMFRTSAEQLPNIRVSDDIAKLANDYSDTLRGTHLADHSREPDSIHALHLTALAVPYARAHYPDLDPGKVALYSPLHDLLEAYTGDKQTFNITPENLERKHLDEALAIIALRSDHGDNWPELINIIESYESIADDEAAFVKTFDKNDPGYTHFRNRAYALRVKHKVRSSAEFYARANENTLRTLGYASLFPLVLEDKDVLNDRIASLL